MGKNDHTEDVSIVIDPYRSEAVGLRLGKLSADIVTLNNTESKELDAESVAPGFFLIDNPGEYEIKHVYIQGIRGFQDKKKGSERGVTNMFAFYLEGITIAHVGYLGSELSAEQIEKLQGCDILMLPVGNNVYLTTAEALSLVNQIEPKLVIPMLYKIPGVSFDYDDLAIFSKEMVSWGEPQEKLRINKKDLVGEGTKLLVLKKE